MNGKRSAEDSISVQKRTRIKLASPPPPEISSESDTESVHSYQGYKTELADDTSDISSTSIIEPYHAEYEIVEPEKEKLRFYLSDDSFEQEDFQSRILKVSSSDSLDNGLLGDTSEENSTSPTSNSDVDPGLPRNDYLDFEKCLLCQTNEKDISYPYCPTCFTWKKNLFPDRPRRKKRGSKRGKSQSETIVTSDCTSDSQNNKNKSKNKNNSMRIKINSSLNHGLFDDSGVGTTDAAQSEDTVDGPSQPSTSSSISTSTSTSTLNIKNFEPCSVCFLKPENGLFVHLNTAHRYGCYSCAKEIWYQNGGCPICRQKVFKVTKLYFN